MENKPVHLADLQRLFQAESPDLPELLAAFLAQDDPDLFEVPAPEPTINDDGEEASSEPTRLTPPEGWVGIDDHLQALRAGRAKRSSDGRRKAAQEAWHKYLSQDGALLPPRLALGDLIEGLYDRKTPSARALLLRLCSEAPLRFGVWRGLKRVYKRSEADLDAEVFGALAARFDHGASLEAYRRDVSDGTLAYLRRRAWRFLRQLGVAVPELYPQFAAQVLRHYDNSHNFSALWVGNHIVGHGTKHYNARAFSGRLPPEDMVKHRAYPESWKRAPDTLMFVLETARCDATARFAIQGLQKDFPDRLRNVTPVWLARLAERGVESIDEFLVETLMGSPEFHQGKLRALGLHDAVLRLLTSPSKKARKYAVEYARAHARDLSPERLFELLSSDEKEVVEMAKALVTARPPRELGYEYLGRLLALKATHDWAERSLNESFERKELPLKFLVDMVYGAESEQSDWATEYLEKKYTPAELGARFWTDALDDKRAEEDSTARRALFKGLHRYKAPDVGADWLLGALTRHWLSDEAAGFLKKASHLPGLDVERLKGMVFNASFREAALAVLGNPKLLTIKEIGLPWMLALARRADPGLHDFAHRYLLENLKPADFADGDAAAGVARLFALALGEREPEPIRVFAQTYLRCHHPTLGPEQSESKEFALKPQLKEADFDPERLWNALFDGRADVRQFALLLVRPHLRKWNLHTRVYELADLDPKEIRNLAYEALQGAGDPGAAPEVALKLEELSAAPIFQMTESPRRPTREVAMELIRKHYGRLGGSERLGWLMQSADREVRLFAVRLLWEKHRPRTYPEGWKPRTAGDVPLEDGGRFGDVEALRGLLRRLLFGLPPGRAPAGGEETKRRHVSASVVKRNVVDLVRDLGVEDAAFASLVVPVLQEFTGSLARGEWQACLSALSHLHSAHPELGILRALWRNTTSATSKKFVPWPAGRGSWCWAACATAAPARSRSTTP